MVRFADVVDLASRLTAAEQEQLAEVLRKRAVQQRRQELAAEVRQASAEHRAGKSKRATPKQIAREIFG